MRICDIVDVIEKYHILESKVLDVISKNYDKSIKAVNSIEVDSSGKCLDVSYLYSVRNCKDNDNIKLSFEEIADLEEC